MEQEKFVNNRLSEIFKILEIDKDIEKNIINANKKLKLKYKKGQNKNEIVSNKDILNKETEKTKVKKVDNIKEPKKPLSAYKLYSKDKRVEVLNNNPDKPSTEITKEIKIMWKNLSNDKKKVYFEKAEKEKNRYEEEMIIFKNK